MAALPKFGCDGFAIGVALGLFLWAVACGHAGAGSLAVTPSSLKDGLNRSRPGDTLVLSAGDYGDVAISNRSWPTPVTLDAHAATFISLVFKNVDGLNIVGGSVHGLGGRTAGVLVTESRDVSVADMTITGAHHGVTVDHSRNIVVTGLTLTGLLSDGIDIAQSWGVRIDHNACTNFSPRQPVFDASGGLVTDGDHPDCIQAWSHPDAPPTSDLTITNNTAVGTMQGISLFNHVHNGVDDGGFDRIVITGNRVKVGYGNGISLYSGRGSVVRDNDVRSIPGTVMTRTGRPMMKTQIRIVGGTGNVVCGNTVPDAPLLSPETQRCRP